MTMDKPEEGDTPETVPLMCDGFDDAVIGVAHRCGQMDLVVYDTTKIIKILVKQGMSREDAWNESYDPMEYDEEKEADKADRARYRAVVLALRPKLELYLYTVHQDVTEKSAAAFADGFINDILGDAVDQSMGPSEVVAESAMAKAHARPGDTRPVGSTSFDFAAHLAHQAEWSAKTFGPGDRTLGVSDHIRKELQEIASAAPGLDRQREWIDVVILALDGAWRSGMSPLDIINGILAKQARNEARTWQDWRTADPDKAIEHDRAADFCEWKPWDHGDGGYYGMCSGIARVTKRPGTTCRDCRKPIKFGSAA
jgi:hypothetical protein